MDGADETLPYEAAVRPTSGSDDTIKYGDETIKYEGFIGVDSAGPGYEESSDATLPYPSPFFSDHCLHPSVAQQPPFSGLPAPAALASSGGQGKHSSATPQKRTMPGVVPRRGARKENVTANVPAAKTEEWLVPVKRRKLEAAAAAPQAAVVSPARKSHGRAWTPLRALPGSTQKAKQITLTQVWGAVQRCGQAEVGGPQTVQESVENDGI